MTSRLLSRLIAERDGTAAIEFAIVGNVFLLFILGLGYTSIMLWHEAHLNWAVDTASRLAAVKTTTTQADISTAVNSYLSSVGMGTASVTYSVATLGGAKVGQINATLTETMVVPLLSTFHLTYTASAKIPQP